MTHGRFWDDHARIPHRYTRHHRMREDRDSYGSHRHLSHRSRLRHHKSHTEGQESSKVRSVDASPLPSPRTWTLTFTDPYDYILSDCDILTFCDIPLDGREDHPSWLHHDHHDISHRDTHTREEKIRTISHSPTHKKLYSLIGLFMKIYYTPYRSLTFFQSTTFQKFSIYFARAFR